MYKGNRNSSRTAICIFIIVIYHSLSHHMNIAAVGIANVSICKHCWVSKIGSIELFRF